MLKGADQGDIFPANGEDKSTTQQLHLSPGFEEELKGLGIMGKGWAAQLEILAHPLTGEFVSHCGVEFIGREY